MLGKAMHKRPASIPSGRQSQNTDQPGPTDCTRGHAFTHGKAVSGQ